MGKKCIDLVVPKVPGAAVSSSNGAKASAPPAGGDDSRGAKRRREEDGAVDEASAPPQTKPKREIQPGCVLLMEGVPIKYEFDTLKEILMDFGDVRFVELIKP